MKHFHILSPLSRGMLWRIIPLMLVLFVTGVMGVNTAVLFYSQSLPAMCFDTPEMQKVLLLAEQNAPAEDPLPVQMAKKDALHNALLEYPQVETIYYTKSFTGYPMDGQKSVFHIQTYSKGYLDKLNWPLTRILPVQEQDRSAIPVWADVKLQGAYHTGDILNMELRFLSHGKIITTLLPFQIVGFLPRDNMYPSHSSFNVAMEPMLGYLYQFSSGTIPVLVAPIEDVVQVLRTNPEMNAFFEIDTLTSFPSDIAPFMTDARNIAALQLRKDATKQDIQFIEEEIVWNAQGKAYTIKEIIQADQTQWKDILRQVSNNLVIFLFISIMGIGSLEFSFIRRKRKEVSTLRLLGVSWCTLRQSWLMILTITGCGMCLMGCLLFEQFTTPFDALHHLQEVPWLRFTPVLLILAVTIIINCIAFIGWRSMEDQEMRRSE